MLFWTFLGQDTYDEQSIRNVGTFSNSKGLGITTFQQSQLFSDINVLVV